jgi:hypothetical protein
MNLRPALAVLAVTGALTGGAVLTAAPALACGDTPGFCPNPPTNSSQNDGSYVVGTDGDW